MPFIFPAVNTIKNYDTVDTHQTVHVEDAHLIYDNVKYRARNIDSRLKRITAMLSLPTWIMSSIASYMIVKPTIAPGETAAFVIMFILVLLFLRASLGSVITLGGRHLIMAYGMGEDYDFMVKSRRYDNSLYTATLGYRDVWHNELADAISRLSELYIDPKTYTLYRAYEFIDIDASSPRRLTLKIPAHITPAYGGPRAQTDAVNAYVSTQSDEAVTEDILNVVGGIMPVIEHRENEASARILKRINTTEPLQLINQLKSQRDMLINQTANLNDELEKLTENSLDIIKTHNTKESSKC